MLSNIGTARANQIIVLLRFAVLISTISSANANTTLSAEESIELRIHQESLEKSIETTTTAGTKSPVKTETIPATTTTTKQMAKTTTPAPVMAALSPDFVPFVRFFYFTKRFYIQMKISGQMALWLRNLEQSTFTSTC